MSQTATASPPPLPANFVPSCPSCQYDLSGIPDGKCPECGQPFSLETLHIFWLASHPNPLAGFAPTCPKCMYDLAGIPQGRCPECGTSYTIADLQRRWMNRGARSGRSAAAFAFLALATVLHIVWVQALDERTPPLSLLLITGVLLTPLMLIGAFVARGVLCVKRPWLLLFGLAALLMICLMFHHHLYWVGPMFPLPAALGIAAAWLATRNRHPAIPALLIAMLFLPTGLVGFGSALSNTAAGHYWSNVDGIFPPFTDRRPISIPADLTLGGAFLLVGAIAALRSFVLLIRPRHAPLAESGAAAPR